MFKRVLTWLGFHVHEWTFYKEFQDGPIGSIVHTTSVHIGHYKDLERSCKTCGDIELKRIKVYI